MDELIDYINSEGITFYYKDNVKSIILEHVRSSKCLTLTLIHQKQFNKGNLNNKYILEIKSDLLNSIVKYNDYFELMVMYGKNKRGLYRTIISKK